MPRLGRRQGTRSAACKAAEDAAGAVQTWAQPPPHAWWGVRGTSRAGAFGERLCACLAFLVNLMRRRVYMGRKE